MSAGRRDVVITGIGLVTCLGEGPQAHLSTLAGGEAPGVVVDTETCSPYPFHPLPDLNYDTQIPRRGDQRQMEPLQRIGTYTAGLALAEAGLSGQADLLARTDMIVASGGGERDIAVDGSVLTDLVKPDASPTLLNERLSNDLRPTLFLAQLPNLLAGNISIVHKVTGSSRTFMGEEAAGVDALSVAQARIAAGQSDICLVGGSYNAARQDMLLLFELGGHLWREAHAPVWSRAERGGGMITGSMGAFLVLESAGHAAARGARAVAALGPVQSDRTRRTPGEATACAARQFAALKPHLADAPLAVFSGATGIAAPSVEERGFLTGLAGGDIDVAVRAPGSIVGHGVEAQFPALIAMAALTVEHGALYPPLDDTGLETAADERIDQVLVTCWGHWRGEGMGLVRRTG